MSQMSQCIVTYLYKNSNLVLKIIELLMVNIEKVRMYEEMMTNTGNVESSRLTSIY